MAAGRDPEERDAESRESQTPPHEELTRSQIAAWVGLPRQTVAKWLAQPPAKPGGRAPRTPALRAFAASLDKPLPAEVDTVPRWMVEAFLKATGYMDADGNIVKEVLGSQRGRWQPVEPTIDPVQDKQGKHRRRWYSDHVVDELGINANALARRIERDPDFPKPHVDELGRNYWFDEELDAYVEALTERDAMKGVAGHDDQGRPYRYIKTVREKADGIAPNGRAYKLL